MLKINPQINNYGYKNNPMGFKSAKSEANEAQKTSQLVIDASKAALENHPGSIIVPSGSWMTGQGFDPRYSDRDITLLQPHTQAGSPEESYAAMESEYCNLRETITEELKKRFKAGELDETLAYVNAFPTPQIQNLFDSHDQFIAFTNADSLNLNGSQDNDTGLWGVGGLVASHIRKEGWFMYIDKEGKVQFKEISSNLGLFNRLLDERDIKMPKEEKIYLSDKLKIIDGFIEYLDRPEPVNKRTFYKYTKRIQKFFNENSTNDMIFASHDPKKTGKSKFKEREQLEKEFEERYRDLLQPLALISQHPNEEIPDKLRQETYAKLLKFKAVSQEILQSPSLKTFDGKA